MTRKELVAAVHAGTDGMRGRAAADAAVDIIIKTITAALCAGEDVEINSFGKFVHDNGRRHVGRNFKTGETIEISARRSVIFRPANELRQVLDHSKNNILRSRQSSLESQLYIIRIYEPRSGPWTFTCAKLTFYG
jgi:nucleoid DNA-binding protein